MISLSEIYSGYQEIAGLALIKTPDFRPMDSANYISDEETATDVRPYALLAYTKEEEEENQKKIAGK